MSMSQLLDNLKYFTEMASKQDIVEEAIKRVKEKEITLRKASLQYGIPKSTLSLYVNEKLQPGSRRGPASILTQEEEEKLVEYAAHMAQIGYGCTREQILDIVVKIVAKDGRVNPFTNGRPDRKWWSLFRKRNKLVTLRTPEKLQLARAKCCTPEVLQIWYDLFKAFLEEHNLLNKPQHLWNADEAGFPLCATSGKVLSIRGCKNVYSITADTKEQITILCAVSAVGEAIPPMEIFPGTRFKYNPMLNCVEGAYFGHSPSGWSTAELFYGWITNHFSKKVTIRPVVLLVDGHTSHIDLHTSTYCKENNILLYCLPPHSSHLTQPLDVSFYKPLKAAWGKACTSYSTQHPGYQVTKHEFSQVFREAWISCVKLSTIIHGFEGAGLYPFNPSKVITEDKLLSSMQFSAKKSIPVQSIDHLAVFEGVLSEEKVKKFQERYEEGFDVVSDELYCAWKKMKELSLVDTTPASSAQPPTTDGASNSEDTALKGSVLDDILVYPGIPENKRSGGRSKALPAHLSGEQFVQYLQEKKDEKDKKEEEKRQRQIEREQKKKECQLLKAQREEERKKKQKERRRKNRQPCRVVDQEGGVDRGVTLGAEEAVLDHRQVVRKTVGNSVSVGEEGGVAKQEVIEVLKINLKTLLVKTDNLAMIISSQAHLVTMTAHQVLLQVEKIVALMATCVQYVSLIVMGSGYSATGVTHGSTVHVLIYKMICALIV